MITPNVAENESESFSSQVALAQGSEAVRQIVAQAVQTQSRCAGLAVFESPERGRRFVRTLLRGTATDADQPFFNDGTLSRWLRVNDELLVLAERPNVWAHLSPEEQQQLRVLNAQACLPLVADAELIGFVVLTNGPESGSPVRDPRLLEAIGRHGAHAWNQLSKQERARHRSNALRRSQQLGVAGQVAASVAHEVRNPLAVIRSLVQFARDVALPSDERESMLDDVLQEVDRIDRTLTGMLQLSQPAAPVRTSVRIDEMAQSASRFVRAYARRRGVTIETEIPAAVLVLADEREIRQVITNLLLNACQACDEGGRVALSIIASPATPPVAEIDIRDTGGGIAHEHLDKIFEPFFTTKPQGTGLGLAFCREVVTSHGGTITLDSVVGVGTTVHVRLPRLENDGIDSRR